MVRENIWCTKFCSRLSLPRDFISSDPLTLYDVTAVAGLLHYTQTFVDPDECIARMNATKLFLFNKRKKLDTHRAIFARPS